MKDAARAGRDSQKSRETAEKVSSPVSTSLNFSSSRGLRFAGAAGQQQHQRQGQNHRGGGGSGVAPSAAALLLLSDSGRAACLPSVTLLPVAENHAIALACGCPARMRCGGRSIQRVRTLPAALQASSDSTDHPHHHYAGSHRAHHANIHHAHGHLHHSHPKRLSHREAGPPAEALAALAEQHGVGDRRAFVHAVHKLPVGRQHELVQHAGGVAAYLQVGVACVAGWVPGCLSGCDLSVASQTQC